MFKCAKYSLHKLSLRSEFNTLWQLILIMSDPYFQQSNVEKLQL